ncbi:hypothetical protein BDV93DRAFT_525405 [Ceratobasidium sp. AG-I]|nr:hypothetical protein BDV93DRAFT_525405 [Ceratobasidium sp. AG-I]
MEVQQQQSAITGGHSGTSHPLPSAPLASTSFRLSSDSVPPRPPSGFMRLLDELYPEDEDSVSETPLLDWYPEQPAWLADWPEMDDTDDFGSIILPPLTHQSSQEELDNIAGVTIPNGSSYQISQDTATQTPTLPLAAPPIIPPPTQFMFPVQSFFSPTVPNGEFDFGPIVDFSQLMGEFFPERVDQILSASILNERPNDDET